MAERIEQLASAIVQTDKVITYTTFTKRTPHDATPRWQAVLSQCMEAGSLSAESCERAVKAVATAKAAPVFLEAGRGSKARSAQQRIPPWRAPALNLVVETLHAVDISKTSTDNDDARVVYTMACYFLATQDDVSQEEWDAGVGEAMIHAVGMCITALNAFANTLQPRGVGIQHPPSASADIGLASSAGPVTAQPILECYVLELLLRSLVGYGARRQRASPAEMDHIYRQLCVAMQLLSRLLAADACGCDAQLSRLHCASPVPGACPLFGKLLARIAIVRLPNFGHQDLRQLVCISPTPPLTCPHSAQQLCCRKIASWPAGQNC
jgi:hypothetical protein